MSNGVCLQLVCVVRLFFGAKSTLLLLLLFWPSAKSIADEPDGGPLISQVDPPTGRGQVVVRIRADSAVRAGDPFGVHVATSRLPESIQLPVGVVQAPYRCAGLSTLPGGAGQDRVDLFSPLGWRERAICQFNSASKQLAGYDENTGQICTGSSFLILIKGCLLL